MAQISFTVSEFLNCFDSWIDAIKPNWREEAHNYGKHIFEWLMWCIIDPAQDLIGSEAMSVVVRMSLQSE